MSNEVLIDKYGRQLNYLRLSVTDRCNFRCYYCMPEEGMQFVNRKHLLSFDEMLFLSRLFCDMGVSKIRITGGEPFVRAGIMPFLETLSTVPGLDEITITTNGTLSSGYVPRLLKAGIRKVNISLDSLDRDRFFRITRRDSFDTVFTGIFQLLEAGFEVKLNCVLAENKNTEDILPFIELTRLHDLSVRFLEEMPFNGSENFSKPAWNHETLLGYISRHYSNIHRLPAAPSSTSVNYRITGHRGSFGIIPSYSRTFCGTCNRVRLSATGELRTCLYGPPVLNLRDLLRSGASIVDIKSSIKNAVSQRVANGFEAEALTGHAVATSMSVLGG